MELLASDTGSNPELPRKEHMTDKSKPWLAAKTAGEALLLAMPLIEWHEAQRERVGEYWKVRTLMHDYDYTDEQIARDTAYGSEPRAKLIHVTRYRRKR